MFLTAFLTLVSGSIKFYTLGCLVLVGRCALPGSAFFKAHHGGENRSKKSAFDLGAKDGEPCIDPGLQE